MKQTALYFLRDDSALRMVASWPVAGQKVTEEDLVAMLDDDSLLCETAERWAVVAGVSTREAVRESRVLFANGLVLKFGEVPPLVEAFVKRTVLESIPKQKAAPKSEEQ